MRVNYFFAIFALLLFLPFVSAQYYGNFFYGTEQVIDSIVMNLEPLFRALLGGYDWSGYLLFEKILLFILISIVVGLILQKLPVFENWKGKKILRLVAVIIGILGVRNLNYIWVGTILVQYQVLFIAIAGILPFMIFWYFIKDTEKWVGRIAWIFYAIIYLGLWATTDLTTYSEVYLWCAIASLIYAFFFHAMVQRWLALQEARRGDTTARDRMVATLKKEIDDIIRMQAAGYYPNKASADRDIKNKQNIIKSMMKN